MEEGLDEEEENESEEEEACAVEGWFEDDEEERDEDEEADVMLCVSCLLEERVLEETKPRLLGVTVAADTSGYVSETYNS